MTKQEKLSKINNELTVAIAEEKARKAAAEADYYARVHRLQRSAQEMRESVNNEPDEQQDGDQPTVWLNGEQWTAAVVARRIINKLPKLNHQKESIYIEISPSYFGGCGLELRYINTIGDGVVKSCEILAAKDVPMVQEKKVNLWLEEVKIEMAKAQEMLREESGNE